jgi:hypothetical protein
MLQLLRNQNIEIFINNLFLFPLALNQDPIGNISDLILGQIDVMRTQQLACSEFYLAFSQHFRLVVKIEQPHSEVVESDFCFSVFIDHYFLDVGFHFVLLA